LLTAGYGIKFSCGDGGPATAGVADHRPCLYHHHHLARPLLALVPLNQPFADNDADATERQYAMPMKGVFHLSPRKRVLQKNLYYISRSLTLERAISTLNDSGIRSRHSNNAGGLTGMILWRKVAGNLLFNSIDTYTQNLVFLLNIEAIWHSISTLIIAVYKWFLCSRYSSEKSTQGFSLPIFFRLSVLP
jgi:hypothetical protein